MTAPSTVLSSIVTTLRTRLGAGFTVKTHDGALGADGKDKVTFDSPGVLVTCLGWPSLAEDDGPPGTVRAHFVAFCHARAADSANGQVTSGMVAMDLAHVVTGIVRTERWGVPPTTVKDAEKLRASNEFSNALDQKGIRVWAVQWLQEVELELEVDTETLNRLAGITMKFAVVDEGNPDDNEFEDDTSDEQADVDFPEPTP